jgi:hypothetical protein
MFDEEAYVLEAYENVGKFVVKFDDEANVLEA